MKVPRDNPVYKAASELYRGGSFASLILTAEGTGSLNLSLHPGYDDKALVMFAGDNHGGKEAFCLFPKIDRDTAYNLAAILLAWADCERIHGGNRN